MDRVEFVAKHTFKKFLWTCPVCKVEEMEDRPVGGGASYEHTCKNGHKFNQSGSNAREYNHTLTMSTEEYEKLSELDIEEAKQAKFDAWIYEIKNPPKYVEPTSTEIQKMIDEKNEEVARLTAQKAEIVAKESK